MNIKTALLTVLAAGIYLTASAQKDGFSTLPSGVQYKIIKHGDGRRVQMGDNLELHLHSHVGDTSLFDTRTLNNNLPVPVPCKAPQYKGDFTEGLPMLSVGDSAIFHVSLDTLEKAFKQTMPVVRKHGDVVEYQVVVVSARNADEMKADAVKQAAEEDKTLQAYFKQNNIQPTKDASGLYYVITKKSLAETKTAQSGQSVSVNYTGKFMDGRKFDSNMDTAFHHVQAFEFELGKNKVIKGWDIGIELLKKGEKATLYIPSALAYGDKGNSAIPKNTILIFDVELVNAQTPEKQDVKDDKILQDYFKKNKIKATKTKSGLYYKISNITGGDSPKPGQNVTVNYTGRTLDGKMFDSNVDPSKGHVSPFSFPLGQGRVIKGWDEGIALLKKGEKGTLYIPSGLAYGPGGGGGGAIPPNAVLMFDVEITDISGGN